MAIYIERQVNPPSKNEEKPQMFPRITDSEIVSEQQLAELMASHGTLSQGNAKAALNDLSEVTAKLQGGKSARRMKRVFVDMDNVLVDFQSGLDLQAEETKKEYEGRLDEIPGLFAEMKPMPGAIEAMHTLQKYFDLYILSTAPLKNPSAWSDKVKWVTRYLDDVFHKRMVITHCKNLCKGDFLIDDRGKNGTSEFEGEWIQFGNDEFPDRESTVQYLMKMGRDSF